MVEPPLQTGFLESRFEARHMGNREPQLSVSSCHAVIVLLNRLLNQNKVTLN